MPKWRVTSPRSKAARRTLIPFLVFPDLAITSTSPRGHRHNPHSAAAHRPASTAPGPHAMTAASARPFSPIAR